MPMNEATRLFITDHQAADVHTLALKKPPAGVDLRLALTQIEGRQKMRRKVPAWAAIDGLLYPPALPLEQCSGESAARYKNHVITRLLPDAAGRRVMIDLTGGLGVDFSWASRLFKTGIYVERDAHLCRLARHNFPLLGLQACIIQGDGEDELRKADCPFDLVCLDPARRNAAGHKTVSLADCEPDVTRMAPLLLEKAKIVLIKLSPMLDCRIAIAQLPCVAELHIVATGGECKELLAVIIPGNKDEVRIHCSNDNTIFSFTYTEEAAARCPLASHPATYLYEPNAALMKGGAFNLAGTRFSLSKLHPNSHLYTSDTLITDFPGRAFRISAYSGCSRKESRLLLQGITQANLSVRNFPETAQNLRRKLRLEDGGDTYLFATTGCNGQHWLIRCTKAG